MMKRRQSSLRNTVIALDMVRERKLMSTCRRLKTVLIDLSGTIHVEDKEIPGAIEALKRLRKSELKTKFVTNTTKESKRVLVERLNKIGFNVSEYDVFTSLTAARDLVCQRHLRPMLVVDDRALEDFEDIPVDNPNAVVIGLAPDKFDYASLNQAFKLVLDGCPIIAIHKGRYYKTKEGLSLGPGPFVSALEYATDSSAEVVGKPEKQFFLSAISDMNCKAEECIMIGDDVRDDVGGSQSAGMKGILVKTGKYRDGDESKIDPRPHHVAKDFHSAVDYILTNLQPPS